MDAAPRRARPTVALTRFLLRSFYFSIVNNPVWFVLAPFVLVYVLTGLLGRHEVLLIMLFVAATHRFVRTFRARPWQQSMDPAAASMRLLPVDEKTCRRSVLAAVLVYTLGMGLLLTVVLVAIEQQPPWLKPPEVKHHVMPTGDTLTFAVGEIMDKSGWHDTPRTYVHREPVSLVFASLQRLPLWQLWVFGAFAVFLLFDAWLHYADAPRGAAGRIARGLGHGVGVVQGLCIAVVMTDTMLAVQMNLGLRVSARGMWACTAALGAALLFSVGAWWVYLRRAVKGGAGA